MLLVSTLVSRLLAILVEMASFIRLLIITPAATVLIRSSHWDCSPVDYDPEKPIFFFLLRGAPFSLLVRRSWCSMEPKEKKNFRTWQNMPICFALDVELLLYHGLRLMETTAGSVI